MWLTQLLTPAIADSARVLQHAPGAVHALRVRMKKLRALLDLAVGRENQRIRNLRQACQIIKASLTASRESEV